ncbi:hypothetical protein CDD82_6484 [Ophiocordyceps australis]|uniref:Uncharacterized protein n=1 Tax=Ophiocordyceps australis TaxID=1399860 RepID=A0A2C5YWS2_9HYPO|nr:hypothetical protein CDD82_6484 [Ophiocordyceps australis]
MRDGARPLSASAQAQVGGSGAANGWPIRRPAPFEREQALAVGTRAQPCGMAAGCWAGRGQGRGESRAARLSRQDGQNAEASRSLPVAVAKSAVVAAWRRLRPLSAGKRGDELT